MKKEVLEFINEYIKDKTIISEEEFKRFLSRLLPESDNYYFQLMELYAKNVLYKYNTGLLKPCNGRVEYEFSPIFEESIKEKALACDNVKKYTCDHEIVKIMVIKKKLSFFTQFFYLTTIVTILFLITIILTIS